MRMDGVDSDEFWVNLGQLREVENLIEVIMIKQRRDPRGEVKKEGKIENEKGKAT